MNLISCKEEIKTQNSDKIQIRLSKDPEKLNPIFNPSARAREVYQYIFLPLADFHPNTLTLHPILIDKVPNGRIEGELIAYDIQFNKKAKWSDGRDITSADYLFTIKSILHPSTKATAWRALVSNIKNVTIDKTNTDAFTVFVDKDYMLSKEVSLTIDLLPKHIYDPKGLLDKIEVSQFHDEAGFQKLLAQDTSLANFALAFNQPKNYTTQLIGAGPYEFVSRESNQYIQLKKVENYWGASQKDNPFLQSFADEMLFKIIPDEMAAVTALKDGQLDVMKIRASSIFHNLKEEKNSNKQLNFYTAQLNRYTFIAINNQDEILTDLKVRKAIAQLVNVDDIINTIDYGYGKRTLGPIHPEKPYYNNKISPVSFDPAAAMATLKNAGWTDSDKDGDFDKVINGKKVDLALDLLITGASTGKKAALLIKENAEKNGVIINIVEKDIRRMRNENLYPGDYDLALLMNSGDAQPMDPYPRWHSDNTDPGEQNNIRYSNPTTDKIIEEIRSTKDESKRNELYLDFQQRIYEDQPMVFLYFPFEKIVVSKKYNSSVTSKRPGYLANTFSLK